MKRGLLILFGFLGGAVITWLGLALFMLSNEARGPGDNGGSAMGAGMFLISGGAVIAVIVGAVASALVWASTRPRDDQE